MENEKKSSNIFKGILGLALVGLGIYAYKKYKKNYKVLSEKSKNKAKAFKEAGLTEEEGSEIEERLLSPNEEDRIDRDINLPLDLFREVRFNSLDLPVDIVSTENLSKIDGHVVHITQRFNRKTNRNELDFLFQIPMSALLSGAEGGEQRKFIDGKTSVKDFVKCIKGLWDRDKETTVGGFVDKMRQIIVEEENQKLNISAPDRFVGSSVEAYMYLSYEEFDGETWESKTKFSPLPRFSENPFNSNHTKACELVWDFENFYQSNDKNEPYELPSSDENLRGLKVLDAIMTIRLSFNMQDSWHLDGINKTSGARIIKEIWENLEVLSDDKGSFRYTNFYFYVPDCDEVMVYTEEDGYVRKELLYN